MAGHLEVDRIFQQDLYSKLWEFLDNKSIKAMIPFKRYGDGKLTWQKLTEEYFEEDDGYVLSLYPWTFEFDGEVSEGASAEIHLSPELTVNKVYMVM